MRKRLFDKDQLTDTVAIKIAHFINKTQKRFCQILTRLTRNFSVRTWRIIIVLFAFVWGILSVCCVANAFTKKAPRVLKPGPHVSVEGNRNDSLVMMEKIYEQRKK